MYTCASGYIRYTVTVWRIHACGLSKSNENRPYGIRDARIIPVRSYIIPNKKIIDITCAAPTVHYIFVTIDHIF